jgi:phospholipid/cholesterol/gamma-HCH transport system ATP-binding protein
VISFVNVKKSFGDKAILRGVSFDVREGEVFFIIGSSGVGKSVLIKQLVGLLSPDEGQIFLDGEDITGFGERQMYAVRKKCAMVFQHSTLFDSMTCAENVALPLRKHRGLRGEEALAEARKRLEQVRMEQYASSMRKRVAIARALTLEPRCVLFDEPTTSLDPVSARRIDRLIRELGDDMGVTSIVVSHDLRSIFGIADRVAMLYKGEVRLLGTPEELRRSDDAVVQQFINGRSHGPMD